MAVHPRKVGHTEPETGTMVTGDPAAALDLTNATAIKWIQRLVGATTPHVAAGTVVKDPDQVANKGKWSFDPVDAGGSGVDAFDTAGMYEQNFEITWSDGDVTYHPDDGYEIYDVQANLK